jgi:uridine phosphorylase
MNPSPRNIHQPIPHSELLLRQDSSVYHLGVRGENIADQIIIVGDPERVPQISQRFDRLDFSLQTREFAVHTGELNGKRLTVASSGIGVDNIDILINELDAAVNIDPLTRLPNEQMRVLEFLRLGTCGTLQNHIDPGQFIISAYAFGLDGVPLSYDAKFTTNELALEHGLRDSFSWLKSNDSLYAVECSSKLRDRFWGLGHVGITATANGFYGPQGRSLRLQSLMEDRISEYARFEFEGLSILNLEMECAGLFALGSMLGHRALTICTVLANRARKEFHSDPSASVESLISQALQRF